MADFLIKAIPLPKPRPEMEEDIPGGVINSLRDIPVPEMAEINLTWPKVGTEWLLQPWYYLKGKGTEFMEYVSSRLELLNSVNIFDFADGYVELGLLLGLGVGIGLIVVLALTGLFKLIGWFDKRYIRNDWRD